jgi:hypothetical protein
MTSQIKKYFIFGYSWLGHVKLIIWFSDIAASAKNRPLACIYHQTKINTMVKKSTFKFSCLLTWIDQRETTPISRWRDSVHSCVFLLIVRSRYFRMVIIDKMEPKDWINMHINTKIKHPPSLINFLKVIIWEPDN